MHLALFCTLYLCMLLSFLLLATFVLYYWTFFYFRCAVGYVGFPFCQPCNCSIDGSTNKDPCVTPCVCKVPNEIPPNTTHTDEYSVWTSPAVSLVSHLRLLIFPLHLFLRLSCLQENVEGENCDRCKMGFYNLQRDNRRGCEKCSCMGVSSHCTESTWTYQNVGNNSEK